MSTARFRSALLLISTSLAPALAWPAPPRPSAAELELGLARTPRLYLVVDLDRLRVEARARGMVLLSTAVNAVAVGAQQPLLGTATWPQLDAPLVWRVVEPPDGSWRRLVAPAALHRYSEAEALAQGARATPAPAAGDTPARYEVGLDGGWQLVISDRSSGGRWRRLVAAVADSRRRWAGRPAPPAPARLELTMAADDARSLVHVFRPGLPILVTAAGAAPGRAGGRS